MCDPTTWQSWNRVGVADEAEFASPGDVMAYSYRPLAIPIRGRIRLEEFREDEILVMRFEQRTFGDVRITWAFENAGAHAFTLDAKVEISEPHWWDTVLHRMSFVVPALRRDVRHALDALHEHFVSPESAPVDGDAAEG